MVEIVRHSSLLPRVMRRLSRPWTRYTSRRDVQRYRAFSQQLLPQLIDSGKLASIATDPAPTITHTLLTRSGVVVAMIGVQGTSQPQAVIKLPLTADALGSLQVHRRIVTTLYAIPALNSFCTLVPRALAWGEHEGQAYYVETALPGQAALDVLQQRETIQRVIPEAAHAALQLHKHTLHRQRIDDATFTRLAGRDLTLLRQLTAKWPETSLLSYKLDRLEHFLRGQIQNAELPLTWIHGDFWLGNLLVDSETGTLNGVIDWDRAAPDELPLHDLLHLLAYTCKLMRRTELGEEVVDYLLPMAFDAQEQVLVDTAIEQLGLPTSPDFLRAMILVYWLRLVAANLLRYSYRQTDMAWLGKNVFLVLKRGL